MTDQPTGKPDLRKHLLTPRRRDFFGPRAMGPAVTVETGLPPNPSDAKAQSDEAQRGRRQSAQFDRAVTRAAAAERLRGSALGAARGVLRALEDLEYVDKIGLLDIGTLRLHVANEELASATSALLGALANVTHGDAIAQASTELLTALGLDTSTVATDLLDSNDVDLAASKFDAGGFREVRMPHPGARTPKE